MIQHYFHPSLFITSNNAPKDEKSLQTHQAAKKLFRSVSAMARRHNAQLCSNMYIVQIKEKHYLKWAVTSQNIAGEPTADQDGE